MRNRRFLLSFLLSLAYLSVGFLHQTMAQSADRSARAVQWDSYALPAGDFVRFVDKQKGYWLWRPAEWSESKDREGQITFSAGPEGPQLMVMTEEIPDGYGVANYTTSMLRQLRSQPIKAETMVVRRIMLGGVEGREVSFEIEAAADAFARETFWITVVGPRAYAFLLVTKPEEQEKYEPYFKRMMMSARIGAAGHWNEEFENLRARFTATPIAGREVEAATLGEALRAGREPAAVLTSRLTELAAKAPDAVLDLLTDSDPQVRAAAITAFGQSSGQRTGQDKEAWEARITDVLLWSLTDKEAYCSATAAQRLAARGPAALAALKSKLSVLLDTPGAIVRAGAALTDEAAREFVRDLLQSENRQEQLAGLNLALALPLRSLQLPYAKLFAASDLKVLTTTVEVIQMRRPADAATELLKLMQGDAERWVVKALGEVAPIEVEQQFNKRIEELDARLGVMVVKANQGNGGAKKNQKKSQGQKDPPLPPPPMGLPAGISMPTVATLEDWKKKPEMERLAFLRGEMFTAAQKIKFRDRWQRASDEAARRAILDEINNDHGDLILWSRAVLRPPSSSQTASTIGTIGTIGTIDSTRFKDAPTTGETLFPSNTSLYLMAPNFAGTLEKLDAALSGVQMGTVRDQMVFALLFKMLKAQLAATLKTEAVGDVGAALGIDLKAPLAMAAWPVEGRAGGAVEENAVVLRVTDRARFERLLAFYHQEFGGSDSFVATASSLTRFVGLMPAAVPFALTMAGSAEARGLPSAWLARSKTGSIGGSAPATIYFRQERLGELPITVIEKLTRFFEVTEREAIYLAYLGATAIIAPTREALTDLLKANGRPSSLTQSEAFTRARAEAGEIVFFSQLGPVLKNALALAKVADDPIYDSFVNALGAETGALHLTPTSWETIFHLRLAENDLLKSIKPFKVQELAAPRELLPPSTILYAGTMIDPTKLLSFIKDVEAPIKEKEKKEPSKKSEKDAKASSSGELDAEIEQLIVPRLQGEIAAALISFKPLLDGSGNDYPAMMVALKLKNRELGELLRAGKLFPKKVRVPDAAVLGAPVVALSDDGSVAVVTDDYLIVADSIETLKLLETKEKFASARDFTRSASAVPGNLALFATYSLDASFDEAQNVMAKSEATQQVLPFISAVTHAFHSQRAVIAVDGNALEGRLAVAFDREGRYGIGELARQASEFDVANALITPKGLNIFQSPRVESLKLRVMAKQPGVAPRLRDDVSKFAWQRVESSDGSMVAFNITARRIPDNSTIKLPVASTPELAPYLRSTSRILSTAPQIVALAKQIAGEDRDGRSVARKLGEWTYSNLKWKKVESDAIETLASHEADCLEHSELYVSLARASGLPARVVTGAAYSGGSFGAHAWVEIYLGQWVEVDPTWGLMDYVDATHLRFDGDSFASYAMLNQIEIEILGARHSIADYQRQPLQLVKVLAASEAVDDTKAGRELMFDLALITEQALGAGQWAKLNEQQRTAVSNAFDRLVAEQLKTWGPEWGSDVRVLTNEIKEGRATIVLLRGTDLLRLTLAAREGAWYLTEVEDLDSQIPIFSHVLRGALQPSANRRQLLSMTPDRALKQLDQLIAAEGENAPLLLVKAQVLGRKRQIERYNRLMEERTAEKTAEKTTEKAEPKAKATPPGPPPRDEAVELLQQIITRWPDFAPAYYALANELLPESDDHAGSDKKIAALQRYAQLVPADPRPWEGLASAFEARQKFSEAEAAHLEVLKRDRESLSPQVNLVAFYLRQSQAAKARASLTGAFKTASDVDAVFDELDTVVTDEEVEELSEEELHQYETLLLSFPKELAKSKAGLRALAAVQQTQKKTKEALATMQRTLTLKPEAQDHLYIAKLNRELRRFTAALAAADQALKSNSEYTWAHVERACALAQLGRQQEALAALKQVVAEYPFLRASLKEEEDLKSLANLPEFKALLEEPDKTQPLAPGKSK